MSSEPSPRPETPAAPTAAVPAAPVLDPRVRRTRRVLQEAMLALAEERDFDAITVGDVTALAGVNRATFYQHYRDKDDLMARSLDALFEEVTAEDRVFAEEHRPVEPGVVPAPLISLFRHLEERRPLYRRLFVASAPSSFAGRLQLFEEAQFRRLWAEMRLWEAPGSPPMELRAHVATSTARAVITWWLGGEGAAPAADGRAADGGAGGTVGPPARDADVQTVASWLWGLVTPLLFSGTSAGATPGDDLPA